MPNSVRGAAKKLEREYQQFRRNHQGRGGGWEYPLNCLPPETQAALTESGISHQELNTECQQTPALITQHSSPDPIQTETFIQPEAPVPTGANAQQRIDAKIEILQCLESFCKAQGLKKCQCQNIFAQRYNAGEIQISSEARSAIPNLSAPTLERWGKTLKKDGVNRLAGKYGNRKGKTKIDDRPALKELVIGMLVEFPHCSTRHITEALQSRFEPELIPSRATLDRWVKAWKEENQEIFTAVSNPDKWKSRFMTAFGSYSEGFTEPNQLWEIDSTPADILLADGRYSLVGAIDVFTRRAALLVTKTSKATAIAALIRRCLLGWGVPAAVKSDRGKDYTSNHVTRVFAGLEIKHQPCQPFAPWQKPHIESFFRTFSHDLLELKPGFLGHNVAERQALEASRSFADRLMRKNEQVPIQTTAEQLQTFCDDWTENLYLHRPHDGLAQQSPFQVLTASRASVKTIRDERALDILLAEAPGNGMRTVQKKGIQMEGTWYIAPELEGFIRQPVQVRLDPHDMGKIYVFGGANLDFICVAQDPTRTGISRTQYAVTARALQQKRVSEGRKELKAIAKKVNTGEIVEQILSQKEAVAEGLIAFPAPSEDYSTPGLRAAQDALEALREIPIPTPTQEQLDRENAAFEEIDRKPPSTIQIRDSRYWYDLWDAIQQGESIAADEVEWMAWWLCETDAGEGIQLALELRQATILDRLQAASPSDRQLA